MNTMKKCPFCGEEIEETASKCKFCGEWVTPQQNQAIDTTTGEKSINYKLFYTICNIAIYVAIIVCFASLGEYLADGARGRYAALMKVSALLPSWLTSLAEGIVWVWAVWGLKAYNDTMPQGKQVRLFTSWFVLAIVAYSFQVIANDMESDFQSFVGVIAMLGFVAESILMIIIAIKMRNQWNEERNISTMITVYAIASLASVPVILMLYMFASEQTSDFINALVSCVFDLYFFMTLKAFFGLKAGIKED